MPNVTPLITPAQVTSYTIRKDRLERNVNFERSVLRQPARVDVSCRYFDMAWKVNRPGSVWVIGRHFCSGFDVFDLFNSVTYEALRIGQYHSIARLFSSYDLQLAHFPYKARQVA